jgi:hypothetical protein
MNAAELLAEVLTFQPLASSAGIFVRLGDSSTARNGGVTLLPDADQMADVFARIESLLDEYAAA